MGQIKPYRITYTAIGTTQPWAGYRIAGYSKDTPKIVLEDYCNNYVHGYSRGIGYKKYFNFECLYIDQRKYMIFSKIDPCYFGDVIHHPFLRIDSVVCSYEETSVLMKDLGLLLTIDRSCFDNILNFEKDSEVNVFDSELSYEKTQTIYLPRVFENNERIELDKSISELFENRKIYSELVKTIYLWNERHFYENLYIVCKQDMNYRVKLAVTLLNSLVYSIRKQIKLEFRDDSYETSLLRVPSLIFCEDIPKEAKYYVIENGDNNIIRDVPASFLNRFDFINYFLENLNDKSVEKYFEMIENNLLELYSDDIKRPHMSEIECAFYLSERELINSEKSNEKLFFLLLDLLHLNDRICSEKVDEYIAGLIYEIINRKLSLNKEVNQKIFIKSKKTENESLVFACRKYKNYVIICNCKKFFRNREK